jgi:hypothetical protein
MAGRCRECYGGVDYKGFIVLMGLGGNNTGTEQLTKQKKTERKQKENRIRTSNPSNFQPLFHHSAPLCSTS